MAYLRTFSGETLILVDEPIKVGDYIGFINLESFVPVVYLGGDLTGYERKITHSTFELPGVILLNQNIQCHYETKK